MVQFLYMMYTSAVIFNRISLLDLLVKKRHLVNSHGGMCIFIQNSYAILVQRAGKRAHRTPRHRAVVHQSSGPLPCLRDCDTVHKHTYA